LGRTSGIVTVKIKNCCYLYNNLCYLFYTKS